tara:strand:+ start:439 stop:780 length:342 start_codon:yes stop_codon:yes gene_type:complete
MLINSAFAQTTSQSNSPGIFVQLLPLILIFGVFYFLLIRPQQKRMKQHRTMVSNIQKGDEVLTSGGVIGKVSSVESDKIIIVEISKDVKIKVKRDTISEVITSKSSPNATKTT